MRVLICHNQYGNGAVGGERLVVQNEISLLRAHGHIVMYYERYNSELYNLSFFNKILRLFQISWSWESKKDIAKVLDDFKPDVMHVHNYKFMLTPSIFLEAKKRKIKTVLTLHNYRLMVPCALYLDSRLRPCQQCDDGFASRILFNKCSQMNFSHRLVSYLSYIGGLRYHHLCDILDGYIVLSEFAKELLSARGIPDNKIFIKPNFEPDPSPNLSDELLKRRRGILFIGRLSCEKGIDFLLRICFFHKIPLTIIGTGPLEEELKERYSIDFISFLGQLNHEKCIKILQTARCLVFPSTCFEGFPLTLLEALSCGVPCIASRLGSRREIIAEQKNGFLYDYDNPDQLLKCIQTMVSLSFSRYREMCISAYQTYSTQYTPGINYSNLINIYNRIA